MSPSARRILILAAVAVTCALGVTVGACVDGQTPDCSDAAAGCGPDNDGAVPIDTGVDGEAGVVDGGSDGDAGAVDAPVDSPLDSPVDAPKDTGGDVGDAKAG